MAIFFKKDILDELKKAGYTSYRLRQEKLLGEATIQKLRAGGAISLQALGVLCKLLSCQPGDIIGYSTNDKESEE